MWNFWDNIKPGGLLKGSTAKQASAANKHKQKGECIGRRTLSPLHPKVQTRCETGGKRNAEVESHASIWWPRSDERIPAAAFLSFRSFVWLLGMIFSSTASGDWGEFCIREAMRALRYCSRVTCGEEYIKAFLYIDLNM